MNEVNQLVQASEKTFEKARQLFSSYQREDDGTSDEGDDDTSDADCEGTPDETDDGILAEEDEGTLDDQDEGASDEENGGTPGTLHYEEEGDGLLAEDDEGTLDDQDESASDEEDGGTPDTLHYEEECAPEEAENGAPDQEDDDSGTAEEEGDDISMGSPSRDATPTGTSDEEDADTSEDEDDGYEIEEEDEGCSIEEDDEIEEEDDEVFMGCPSRENLLVGISDEEDESTSEEESDDDSDEEEEENGTSEETESEKGRILADFLALPYSGKSHKLNAGKDSFCRHYHNHDEEEDSCYRYRIPKTQANNPQEHIETKETPIPSHHVEMMTIKGVSGLRIQNHTDLSHSEFQYLPMTFPNWNWEAIRSVNQFQRSKYAPRLAPGEFTPVYFNPAYQPKDPEGRWPNHPGYMQGPEWFPIYEDKVEAKGKEAVGNAQDDLRKGSSAYFDPRFVDAKKI